MPQEIESLFGKGNNMDSKRLAEAYDAAMSRYMDRDDNFATVFRSGFLSGAEWSDRNPISRSLPILEAEVWCARNENNELSLFRSEPEIEFEKFINGHNNECMSIDNNLFLDLTYKNSPQKVEILIVDNKVAYKKEDKRLIWLSRDEQNRLFLSVDKPSKKEDILYFGPYQKKLQLCDELFPQVNFKSSPVQVVIRLKRGYKFC
jgi:hypothetical protein